MAQAVLEGQRPSELDESNWLEGLTAQMDKIYAGVFPKACACCGRVYRDADEYLSETVRIGKPGSAYFYPEDNTVQEFRDCPCGSTLLLLTGDRRDTSPAGEERRRLFDECVQRLQRLTGRGPNQLRPLVRHAFRAAMKRLSVGTSTTPTDEQNDATLERPA
jgi:hypothetical protein